MVALLHSILVVAFTAVTVVLLTVMLIHRLRIQDVVSTWNRWTFASAWPLLFVGMIGLLALYADNTQGAVPGWVFLGYSAGGTIWFLASILGSGVIVSRHGIVCGLGQREYVMPWVQVDDYVEIKDGKQSTFVFLYRKQDGTRGRLEVPVPMDEIARFRRLADERIGEAGIPSPTPTPGRRATS